MTDNQYSLISNEFIEKNIELWGDEIKNHKENSFKYGYCQGKLMLLHELKQQLIPSEELPQQEISDEKINKEAKNHHNYYEWSAGAKWYREQLKTK